MSALVLTALLLALPSPEMVQALRRGGHVIVMRHATSPREPPTAETAVAGNHQHERQLDEAGRRAAAAMGIALRAAKISVGAVLSSPTFRAQETARYAQLPLPAVREELGDGGQSMHGVSAAQAAWLK